MTNNLPLVEKLLYNYRKYPIVVEKQFTNAGKKLSQLEKNNLHNAKSIFQAKYPTNFYYYSIHIMRIKLNNNNK